MKTSDIARSVELYELKPGHMIPVALLAELLPNVEAALFFAKVYELMAPYGPTYNIIMARACSQLVEGETLPMSLSFEKAGKVDITLQVRAINARGAAGDKHAH